MSLISPVAHPMPRILIIAGSDSGGGAGIQADIKTVTMLGGHAMTAITSITAQNTLGVTAVHAVPADMVVAQMAAVIDDIGVDAIKIGMIGSADTVHAVADYLETLPPVPLVFDPVMVATSGSVLADPDTIAAFGRLMQLATIVTPNLPELAALAEGAGDDAGGAALGLVARYGCAVLIKGGHAEGDILVDTLIEEDNMTSWQSQRIVTRNSHGTGCTTASGIAFHLAQGVDLANAVARARDFVRLSMLEAPGLGAGHGPMGQGAVRLDGIGNLMLNQVTLCMDDFDASFAFYERLGLKPIVVSKPDYARFETGGGATLSIHHDPETHTPGGSHIYLECADLEALVARLNREGFRFEHGPESQPWLWREARLRDPFGNMICLYRAGEYRRFPPWRIGGGG